MIAAQNDELTILPCVTSFLEFGDEIIVVVNKSTDQTWELLQRNFGENSKVRLYKSEEIKSLEENRQVAYGMTRYRWIFRGDADYVAYTQEDGRHSIVKLRHQVLSTFPLWPTVFFFEQVNVYTRNLLALEAHYASSSTRNKTLAGRLPTTFPNGYLHKLYSRSPLLSFVKRGKNETIRAVWLYKKVFTGPYWIHITARSPEDDLRRSARRFHRENDSNLTIDEFVERIHVPKYFPGKSLSEAQEIYSHETRQMFSEYSEEKYFPLPKIVKRHFYDG